MAKKTQIPITKYSNGDLELILSDAFVYDVEYYRIGTSEFNLDHTKIGVISDKFLGYEIISEYENDPADDRYKFNTVQILVKAPKEFLETNNFKEVIDE